MVTKCFHFHKKICKNLPSLIIKNETLEENQIIDLGTISPTYLRTAFTPVAPKSVRIQSSCQYLFMLLGSTGAKAAHRMLMKLTPGDDFTNILRSAFTRATFTIPKVQKIQSSHQCLFALLGSALVKAEHKMLVKMTRDKAKEQNYF